MSTDPKPDHFLAFTNPKGSIGECDPDGVNWSCGVDLVEPQTGVVRTISEKPVGLSGSTLDMLRKLVIGSME